jgi:DNA polymerase-3 subunit beta
MPSSEIEILVNEKKEIIIKPLNNANSLYCLKGVEAEKFPAIKSIEDVKFFSLQQEIFRDMVDKTKFSIGQADNRKFVSGILFEKYEDSLRMVSTDGKRMSFIKKNISLPQIVNINIIVPLKILQEMSKLTNDNGDIRIALTKDNIFMNIENHYFISNLMEGNFPDYQKVIPEGQNKFLIADRIQLYQAIERISILGDKETHKVIFSLGTGKLIIDTENITLGSGEEIIEIEYAYEPVKIAFNYVYLLDVLAVIKGEKIRIEFRSPAATITVKEENNSDYICIMMPMTV